MSVPDPATVDWVPLWSLAPTPQELAYAQNVTQVSCTSVVDTAPNDIVTLPAFSVDGVTPVFFDFFCQAVVVAAGVVFYVALYEGATQISRMAMISPGVTYVTLRGAVRVTPTAGSHTYKAAGYGNAAGTTLVIGGTGGSGTAPTFLRATRAS